MKIELAKKLILLLLIILILTIGLTLFLIHKTGQTAPPEDSNPQTSDFTDTDETDPPESGDPAESTTSDETDLVSPGTTESAVVNPPIVTDPPAVTDPPVTETPNANKAPAGFSLDKTFATDTGVRINLIAECHATRNSDGTVNLTVELYLDHRSLGMGPRNSVLKVGDITQAFTTERIKQDNNTATKRLLQTVSGTFAYGETVAIYANVPVGLTNYGGIQIKTLTIDVSLPLK